MPNLPVQATKPYPTVGSTLQLARAIANDAAGPNGVSGDLLSSSQPYTLILLNSAWQKLQDRLAEAGVESLVKETVISSLPVVATLDDSVNTYITWDGYYDGSTFTSASTGAPALPFDLILPTEIWERPSGSGQTFLRLTPVDGGLPRGFQTNRLRWWEWRDDKVFFKGATVLTDIRVRYVAYQPDLDIADATLIPIMRSKRALAYLMVSEWARARGAPVADSLFAMAEVEIDAITSKTARRKASITYRRRPFGANC